MIKQYPYRRTVYIIFYYTTCRLYFTETVLNCIFACLYFWLSLVRVTRKGELGCNLQRNVNDQHS